MDDSFPAAPGGSGGSFPKGSEPGDDLPTQDAGALLFRRYRVRRELGRGGMGVVLLAHDTALDIDVAVKLMPDTVTKDTEAIGDLRREVLRGMALAHPGIVRTHNFEKDEGGTGIVMEYIDGPDLGTVKHQQPGACFDPEQILPWIEQLCAVLDYAHRDARIVHRDLKPRNIMLTRAGRVKVADFGIAAIVSDSMSRHSMEGKVSGTLSYMSPQQAEGKIPSPLDDIHALGALLYELLTGKPPYFRGGQVAIFQQILHVTPPTIAERRAEFEITDRTAIPQQWEETIAACLAKFPGDRPQSAGEMLARLKATSAPSVAPAVVIAPPPPVTPSVAPAPTPARLASAAPPRSRTSMVWAALVLAAFAGASAFLLTREDKPDSAAIPRPTPSLGTPNPDTEAPAISVVPTPRPATPEPATPIAVVPATPSPATPAPATPPPAPPPARAKTGVTYRGTITQEGERGEGVPLSIRFANDGNSGTMTQGSSVGDTAVKFSGSWERNVFTAQTGEIVSKPTRVRWDGENFTLVFTSEDDATYTCIAGGKTFRTALKPSTP